MVPLLPKSGPFHPRQHSSFMWPSTRLYAAAVSAFMFRPPPRSEDQ